MTKRIILVSALALIPSTSFALDNVGGCGWGSKLMAGNQGIAPQVLAVTTNGTFGNQTFGITSGTSGCSQNGVVSSNWKTAMFIDSNMNKLARDMSVGQGEALDSLASLIGVSSSDKEVFSNTVKSNFGEIFSSSDITSEQVAANLKAVLASSNSLSSYADRV
jgi:hypothetical protein